MSGHSKWSQIKRQKGAVDARRGQLFTKLGREITVAAREGGSDPDGNARLRLAVQKAREANMPMDTIDRAVKRGAGGGEGAALDEVTYEGYGPGGAAILVEVLTDNRNRAVAEVRNAFARGGGNLGESGCVAWLFDPRGVISAEADGSDPDEIALKAIDAGAEDFKLNGSALEIYTAPADLEAIRGALESEETNVTSAEVAMIPKTTMEADPKEAVAVLKLMERLEELDDVQRVYTNLEFSDHVLADFAAR
jgi:YebC/PmpR family DNA-binding regulatory protein